MDVKLISYEFDISSDMFIATATYGDGSTSQYVSYDLADVVQKATNPRNKFWKWTKLGFRRIMRSS